MNSKPQIELSRLRPLALQAIAHWKEHRPAMYRQHKAAGTLNAKALVAAEMTLEEQADLMAQGFPAEAAWEAVRERYVFLPQEDGASEEAPASEGYQTMLEMQKLISLL